MNSQDVSKLLHRLIEGGKVANDEESAVMHQLACALNNPMPKHACPQCWFERLLAEIKEALDAGRPVHTRV